MATRKTTRSSTSSRSLLILLALLLLPASSCCVFLLVTRNNSSSDNSNSNIRNKALSSQRRRRIMQSNQKERATAAASTTTPIASSNVYEQGCLQRALPEEWKRRTRVCNSEDSSASFGRQQQQWQCRTPDIPYPEIRIFAQNWESSLFQAWLLQIVLSEMLDVPTTIETGSPSVNLNFYNAQDRFELADARSAAMASEKEALENAIRNNQDCTVAAAPRNNQEAKNDNATSSSSSYEACAHYIPEIWRSSTSWITKMVANGHVEPPSPTGLIGQQGWFIPKFTAERYPSLTSYLGLQGDVNRRKVAEAFLWPTTWQYYCENLSPTQCNRNNTVAGRARYGPDPVAVRSPRNGTDEGGRFFVEGLYTGYFRRTERNDCDKNPQTCAGHFASYPCSSTWDSLPTAQAYHLDIPLEGNGPDARTAGYEILQLRELWLAANATQNNLIMTWFAPTEPLFQKVLGTEAEMVRTVLPPPTQECLEHRVEGGGGGGINQCSADLATRVGDPRGACDHPINPLQKLYTSGLSASSSSSSSTPAALESPAHYALEHFSISNLQLGEMFDYYEKSSSPREAICQWAADHLDELRSFVPYSYPRVVVEQDDSFTGLQCACIAVGGFAVLVIIITGFNVADQKDRPVMQSAPLGHLFLILTGSLIVVVAAMIMAFPPTNALCVAEIWLVNMGLVIGLVPLSFKLFAIQRSNKLASTNSSSTRRSSIVISSRRVTPECGALSEAVVLMLTIVMVVLLIWTALDPPRRVVTNYEQTDTLTEDGETIISVLYSCSSENVFWLYLQVSWNLLFLLHSAALGFATRNVAQDYNERALLTTLVHCHMVFVLLWLISYLLSSIVGASTLTGFRSLVFSVDAIVTVMVYFFPKFVARDPVSETTSGSGKDSEVPTTSSSRSQQALPPLGPIARFIAAVSGVSSCGSGDQASNSASRTKGQYALVDTVERVEQASLPLHVSEHSTNDDRALVSQLRATVEELEEETQELQSDAETKDMTIAILKEEVGSLMERLMGRDGDSQSVATSTDTRATVRELQEEGRDLRAFVEQQGVSLTQLMDEETNLLQKLESERSVTSMLQDTGGGTTPSLLGRWDKENYANKLYTGDNAEEAMQMGEI